MATEGQLFLDIPTEEHVLQGDHFFVVRDQYPVSPGHCLIISRKNRADFFELEECERRELTTLIHQVRDRIEQDYQPTGYNIGMNCGAAAGQTVMRFHCHVIPRYTGDMQNPAGGIRHCVAGKGYYRVQDMQST